MKLFVNGRKNIFNHIRQEISENDRTIWIHAASLGEYEQAVPILEQIQKEFPKHKILITFFSPSGYEVKRNNEFSHLTTYLPLDTKRNAEKFVKLVRPDLALFIKYEVWPNYMTQLKMLDIPTLLISGNFRTDQIYFRSYGKFMKQALHKFHHLFVQNQQSLNLLKEEGFKNVTKSSDTRFDRVSRQLEIDNYLEFAETFKNDQLCLVCGSTWPEDEALLIDYINSSPDTVKFIIAPHEIKSQKIENFRRNLKKPSLLYSQLGESKESTLVSCPIMIIDTVGLLTKLYAYADIAYVGGAAGNSGLHNILEPAAFTLPIVIGQNYKNFPEAKSLRKEKGLFSVKNAVECKKVFHKLETDKNFRKEIGKNAKHFIQKNQGATKIIIQYIDSLHI